MNRYGIKLMIGVAASVLSWGSIYAYAVDFQKIYTEEAKEAPELSGISCIGKMPLDYAESFNVYGYEEGYKLIDIPGSGQYLIVPEGADIPDGDEDAYKVLQAPIENVYMAATSAMSLVSSIDAMDHITMTGTDVSGWNIQPPIDALNEGRMIFAGKYSEPNYEMLVGNECYLAIESTMIAHSPEVQEMLEAIDIPVFIDRSSYEPSGLGRTEWVKVYGALFDAEDVAFEKFDAQKKVMEEMAGYENTGKTVAYVSINQDGSCVIRRPDDYIAAMIHDGGGVYVFEGYDELAGGGATVTISLEEFYSKAVDADYLVYNGTIMGSVDGKNALLEKSELFSDFKAFQENNLWQVDSSLYQSTDRVAQLIRDFHLMVTGGDESQMVFLSRIG